MKRYALLLMLFLPIIVAPFANYAPCYADKYVLEQGDFVDYGYQLYVNSLLIETITEDNAISINFAPEIVNPPGLFDVLLGMKNGQTKNNVVIPPEEGFLPSDPTYGVYAGETLVYQNLKIYAINHYPYTDVYPSSGGDFGRTLLIILGVVLGLGVVIGASYVIYRYSPKIFGKRCSNCKSLAIGKCKSCGKSFCEKCFSNGCPSCKGRSLIRYK